MDAPLLKAAIDASIEHLRPWLPFASREPQPLQSKIDLIRRWRSDFDASRDFVYGIFNHDESQVLGGSGLHTRAGDPRDTMVWTLLADEYPTTPCAALDLAAFDAAGRRLQ